MTVYKAPDLRETAAGPKDEGPQVVDGRLFMQLQCFTGCFEVEPLIEALAASGLMTVLYLDAVDPRGIAVLAASQDPEVFPGAFRQLLNGPAFRGLTHRPELSLFGRTYATGREANLEHFLLEKPLQVSLNTAWPWAVWYPLRRKGSFSLLAKEDQGKILYEHAIIGMSWGQADYAHDVRLACHGLDRNDNDFVIGLVGKSLAPLSQCVQEMRKTQQTSTYIEALGPFFIGRVAWQSPLPV